MKHHQQGFNYVEILSFLLILGIFAVFTRLFLFTKSSNAEAIQQIRTMNSVQLAYYEEYQEFSKDTQKLQLNLPKQPENYDYFIEIEKTLFICGQTSSREDTVYNYAIPRPPSPFNLFKPKKLKSYVGASSLRCQGPETESHLTSVICESEQPGNFKLAKPILDDRFLKCPKGTKEIKK